MGRLTLVPQPVAPVTPHGPHGVARTATPVEPFRPLFGDTLIGFVPGTGDTSKRYLGRLRDGYTADTLEFILLGDNRPGYRYTRLGPQYQAILGMASLNPAKIGRGLVAIPEALWFGLWPDLGLLRDIPARLRNTPRWGREHQVQSAILAKIDSLNARGKKVTAVINTGDLVEDGRYPSHWERFLRLVKPLSSRVPYFPVAGNHERTDTQIGVENWRAATGLPVGGDRLYYCFDTTDGWVRFIALDTNPIVDPIGYWGRDVQVKYSAEEFAWAVARIREHRGPVIVMMHHPPFSAGFHRMEWQRDSVLVKRRAAMMQALHDAGIAIIASGHEHGYQRALITWPDAATVSLVTGGGGAPLNDLPDSTTCQQLYSEYHVAGARVEAANVVTGRVFHFVHLRLWFGGGELAAWQVDSKSKVRLIDRMKIDLTRYGTPQVDQHKMPIPKSKGPVEKTKEDKSMVAHAPSASDTSATIQHLLTRPPPGRHPATSTAAASVRRGARHAR